MNAASNPWDVRDQQAKLERDGVLCVSRAVPGWWFYIKPISAWNAEYHGAVARMLRTPQIAAYYKRASEKDHVPTPEDTELDLQMQITPFIEGCLVGWKHVSGRDGRPLPFSGDNARALLKHFPNVFQEVRAFASSPLNFSVSLEPDDGGLETARGNS